jgi:hypothetical protein
MFVGVGQNGLRISSEDGLRWQNAQMGKEGEVWRAVCFGNDVFVAVGGYGGGNIFGSTRDGKSWKTSFKDAKYVQYLRGLGFGQKMFLGIGGDPGSVGSSAPFVMTSTEGEAWTEAQSIPGKHILRRLAFGKGFFVGVGDRGRRAVSANGKQWKDVPDVKATDTLVDVGFGNGVFVGVGLHGLRTCSLDGLKWTDRQVGEEGEHLNSILWARDRFVAVGPGTTYTSTDGKTWQRQANTNAPQMAAFGDGVFVGSSWKGRLLHSTDAVTWREVHKCEEHVEAIAFGLS